MTAGRRQQKRRSAGFTIIEVLVAGAVLGFSLVGLSVMAVTMARNRGLATAQVEVGQLATQYLNEYVQWGYTNLSLDGAGTFPIINQVINEPGPDAGVAPRTYSLTVHVTDSTATLSNSISKLVQVTVVYSPPIGSPVTQVSSAYVSQ